MANVTLAGTPTGGETVTVAVNETTAEYTLTKADTTQSAVNSLAAMLNKSFGSLYVAPYIASTPAGSSDLSIVSIWPTWPLVVTAAVTGGDVTATVS